MAMEEEDEEKGKEEADDEQSRAEKVCRWINNCAVHRPKQ